MKIVFLYYLLFFCYPVKYEKNADLFFKCPVKICKILDYIQYFNWYEPIATIKSNNDKMTQHLGFCDKEVK